VEQGFGPAIPQFFENFILSDQGCLRSSGFSRAAQVTMEQGL
jgi:hypothetical protein